MRIVFVCGSLEAGRDGVGDYTLRLCAEVKRKGNEAVIVALNDRYVKEAVSKTINEDGIGVEILRIPHTWPSSRRYQSAKSWIGKFKPDLISLQYVPYAFQKQGTPISLANNLKKVYKNALWHVMVHEPFLAYPQKGTKNKIIQALQITALRLLKKKLNPVFHTTVQHYKSMLEDIAINPKILGLFGNIKVLGVSNKYSHYGKEEVDLLGVYFGAVPPVNQHSIFAESIANFCKTSGKKIKIVLCGRAGALGDRFAEAITQLSDRNFVELFVAGKLESDEISHLFTLADFGISRVPARLIGKSGAAICMLEHGLPLWIPVVEGENDQTYLDFRPELCCKNLEDLKSIEKGKAFERLPLIAAQLMADLELA